MRKKLLIAVIALALCGVSISSPYAAAKSTDRRYNSWQDYFNWQDFTGDDEDVVLDDGNDYWDKYNSNDNDYYDVPDDWTDDYYDDDDWDDDNSDSYWDGYDDYDDDWDDDDWDNDEEEGLSISDITVNPAKKTIKKGRVFYITYVPAKGSSYAKYNDEAWDEICGESIKSISFKSKKSSVASVNRFTGRVKARKKGNAVITTTIKLKNGESVTCKTKVTVKK